MTWYRIEGDLPQSAKYAPLKDSAFRLAITAGAWCAQHMTDGRIPKTMVPALTSAPRGKALADAVESLVKVGIWEDAGDAWELHDFLRYNMSRAQWEKKVTAGAAGGKAKAANTPSTMLAPARHELEQTPSKPLAQPLADPDPDPGSDLPEISLSRDLSGSAREEPEEQAAPAAQSERTKPKHVVRFEASFENPNPAAQELFDAYRTESGKTGARLDHKARELFERLVDEGETVASVRLAVGGAKLDPWARDDKKLAASVILSTAEQREKYRAIARDPPRPKGGRAPQQPREAGGFGDQLRAAVNHGGSPG